MIYCLDQKMYPEKEHYIEELIYNDRNDFEWRIARVENGFFVKFLGDDYFKESMFGGKLYDETWFTIKNTNCIFFQDSDFETFCNMRDIITEGCTDEIWEVIEEFFVERFNQCKDILESEKIEMP